MSEQREQKNSTFVELYDRVWKTKSARFNAYHRLKRKHILSNYTLSLLAVYVIILALLKPFDIIGEHTVNGVNFLSICVSILLLVIVLMENSMEYNLKAEKFHDCAKALAKLFKELEILKEESSDYQKTSGVKSITEKYDIIIDLHENHAPIDYELHRVKNNLKNYSDKKKAWIKLKYNHLDNILYYFAIYFVPLILFVVILILDKSNTPPCECNR